MRPGALAVPLPPEAARQRKWSYLTQTVAALAGQEPVLIVIDDLHWADETTLAYLRAFSSEKAAKGVIVMATHRVEDAPPLLRDLTDAPSVTSLPLPRLDDSALEQMVGDMLGVTRPGSDLVRFVARQSGGNPFFAAEHLHAALATGIVTRDLRGSWILLDPSARDEVAIEDSMPLPSVLLDLVSRRLDDLTGPTAAVLEAAAVLGSGFSEALLALTSGSSEPDLADALSKLTRRQVLREGHGGELVFVQETVRRVCYDRITVQRRALLHRAAADAYEELRPRETPLAVMALHHERAGELDRARPFYRHAGDLALAQLQYREAGRLYERCMALTQASDRDLPRLAHALAIALSSLGDNEGAERHHRVALECARKNGDLLLEGQVLVNLAYTEWVLGRDEEVRRLFSRALEIFQGLADRAQEARILANMAILDRRRGRSRQAREMDLRALEILAEHPHEPSECSVLGNLANVTADLGDVAQSRHLYERSLEIGLRLGLDEQIGLDRINLGELLALSGDFSAGQDLASKALESFHRSGYRRMEGASRWLLGYVRELEGSNREAQELYETALAIARQVGDPLGEAIALLALARVAAAEDRIDESSTLAGRAREVFAAAGDRRHEAEALCLLAEITRRTGDVPAARELVAKACNLVSEAGYLRQLALCRFEELSQMVADGAPAAARLDDLRAMVRMLEEHTGPFGHKVEQLARSIEGPERRLP